MTPANERAPSLPETERHHLERARALGRLGWGHVHPNPMVGCVLVRNGAVVGEGHHQRFGGPHAETVALDAAGARAAGATAYVSLEPCNHHGKTPPCVDALVQAGIGRVVYGAADPGSASSGGGNALRSAGLEVVGPVWSVREARAENPAFFHVARHETPYVALKLAMTLDARIAAGQGRRTRITGEEAEREVHRLRTGFDAVMVGAGTVRTDDPLLTVRRSPEGRAAPRRLVLATQPILPDGVALLGDVAAAPVHVFVPDDADEAGIEALERRGAHVHPVPRAAGAGARVGRAGGAGTGDLAGVDLGAVGRVAWELGIRSILCEGGARVAGALLREDRVHRFYLFVAPTTLGREGVPAFAPDAGEWDPSTFTPALPPALYGRDTLIVLDREEN